MRCHRPLLQLAHLLDSPNPRADGFGGTPWGLPEGVWPTASDGNPQSLLMQVTHSVACDLGREGRKLFVFQADDWFELEMDESEDSPDSATIIVEPEDLLDGPTPKPDGVLVRRGSWSRAGTHTTTTSSKAPWLRSMTNRTFSSWTRTQAQGFPGSIVTPRKPAASRFGVARKNHLHGSRLRTAGDFWFNSKAIFASTVVRLRRTHWGRRSRRAPETMNIVAMTPGRDERKCRGKFSTFATATIGRFRLRTSR